MMQSSAATKKDYPSHGTVLTHPSTSYSSQTSTAESQFHANTAMRLITKPRNVPHPHFCHRTGEGLQTGPLPLLMTAQPQEANALLPTLSTVHWNAGNCKCPEKCTYAHVCTWQGTMPPQTRCGRQLQSMRRFKAPHWQAA